MIYSFILFFMVSMFRRFAGVVFLEKFFSKKTTEGLEKIRKMKSTNKLSYSQVLNKWQRVKLRNDHLISVYRLGQNKDLDKYESLINLGTCSRQHSMNTTYNYDILSNPSYQERFAYIPSQRLNRLTYVCCDIYESHYESKHTS